MGDVPPGEPIEATPQDPYSERVVIGTLLLQPERFAEAAPLSFLSFNDMRHQAIFRGICEVVSAKGQADLNILVPHLQDSGQIKLAGGLQYVLERHREAWGGANIAHAVEVLLEQQARREALFGSVRVAQAARSGSMADIQTAATAITRCTESSAPVGPYRINLGALSEENEDIPWMVYGWFGAGDSILLAGEWGTGKSVLALDLAISLAAGIPWMGRVKVCQPCPVLYIDEENNPLNARRRLRRMAFGRGLTIEQLRALPLTYLSRNHIRLDLASGQSTVRREIERIGAKFMVLDSLVRFARLNANNQDEVSNFFSESIQPIVSEAGATAMMIDHMRKPHEQDDKNDPAHRITGSQDKSSFADNVWTFTRVRTEDHGVLRASKNRWEDRLQLPIETKWCTSEDDSTAWIESKDGSLDAELEIIAVLTVNSGGLLTKDICQTLLLRGVSKSTALRTLKRMAATGQINSRPETGKRVRYWVGELGPVGF